jgi:hypothetical protein
MFKESLDKLKLPYFQLNGDEPLRFDQAIKAIDEALTH